MCFLQIPNVIEDILLFPIHEVAGNNNSIQLMDQFQRFIYIIYVKQLEQCVMCSKGSISNNNNRYHLLSLYNVTASVLSALCESSRQFAQNHDALKQDTEDLNPSVLLASSLPATCIINVGSYVFSLLSKHIFHWMPYCLVLF